MLRVITVTGFPGGAPGPTAWVSGEAARPKTAVIAAVSRARAVRACEIGMGSLPGRMLCPAVGIVQGCSPLAHDRTDQLWTGDQSTATHTSATASTSSPAQRPFGIDSL